MFPLHDCVPHEAVVAASWQTPLPLQLPVFPQGAAALTVHWPVGAAVPAGTLAQLPAAAPTLQDWQSPHEVALQQTPSTQ
jgi:hypothetical protein